VTTNDDPRLLTEANIWLATTRPNGKPHLIPIWFVWVNERFYICTPDDSVKARNLRANPRASVALEDGNKPVIAECTSEFIPMPFPAAVVEGFVRKYEWNISNDTVYRALIELTPQKWLHWQPG
jgi:F420H(2)-dependent biliverdin reductase